MIGDRAQHERAHGGVRAAVADGKPLGEPVDNLDRHRHACISALRDLAQVRFRLVSPASSVLR